MIPIGDDVDAGPADWIPDEADLLSRRVAHAEREAIKKLADLALCKLPPDAIEGRARFAAIRIMMWWHSGLDCKGPHPEFVDYAAHFVSSRTSAWCDDMFGVGVYEQLVDRFGTVNEAELCIKPPSSSWIPPQKRMGGRR